MRHIQAWTLRFMVGAVLGVLLSGNAAWADGSDKHERWARQAIEALMADPAAAAAQITLADGTTRVGRLQALGEHSFLLVDAAGQKTQVPFRQVRRSTGFTKTQIALIVAAGAAATVMIVCYQISGHVLCLPAQ